MIGPRQTVSRACHPTLPRLSSDHRFENDDGSVEEFEMVSSKRIGDWLHMSRRDGTLFIYKVIK